MTTRRIIVDPRALPTPRYANRRILQPEIVDAPERFDPRAGACDAGRHDRSFVRAALRRAGWGARVLDAGTGTAAIPIEMALKRSDLTIVGIDLSEAMVKLARERVRAAGVHRRVRVRKASARKAPFRRGSFDLVISDSLLHHLPDPVPVFNEMARLLAPRGRVFIRDLRRPGPSRIEAHIRRHGRLLVGEGVRLFGESVRAAFKVAELREMVAMSRLAGCRTRPQFDTCVVIEGSPRRTKRRGADQLPAEIDAR